MGVAESDVPTRRLLALLIGTVCAADGADTSCASDIGKDRVCCGTNRDGLCETCERSPLNLHHRGVEVVVDVVVAGILDHVKVGRSLLQRWGEAEPAR